MFSGISPATINKELRHLKAVLRVAHGWKYLPEMPKVKMFREPEKLPLYVTPEHFAAIYKACDVAEKPTDLPYEPGLWWQGLTTFCYMTGWRIGECLSLRSEDVDVEAGTAITRHGDNKGKREELLSLHSVVIDHLRKLRSFEPVMFPCYYGRERLWEEFRKIQEEAGIHLPCREDHEHSPSCHVYGFHDFRRAFATQNAETLTADALQRLMRHKHYSTTQRYINMAARLTQSVENLHVPDVLRQMRG